MSLWLGSGDHADELAQAKEASENEQASDSSIRDPAYEETDMGAIFFLVGQAANLVLGVTGVVQNMQSSYYWFQFGKSISFALTAGYILFTVLTGDWLQFIYDRNLMRMIVDRLSSENIQDDLPVPTASPTASNV